MSFFSSAPSPPPPLALTLTLPSWVPPPPPWCDACLMQALLAGMALLAIMRLLWHPSVPRVVVPLEPDEAADVLGPATASAPAKPGPSTVLCHDPATGRFLGTAHAASDEEVEAVAARGRAAQKVWAKTGFAERRRLLRILSRCTLEHAEDICRVSARDSGKTTTDASFGEVIVTLEKIAWLCGEGEAALRPEKRSAGRMLFYKTARVEWKPRGLIGAIVPWNYPFHNVLNPVTAAIFSGNAIVVKVSEHAAWSARFYERMIQACLKAAGAPADLVQLITGFGPTGSALTRAADLMIFVGSTRVGKIVMGEASKTLTPVVLELGGKDPFVLLPGTDVAAVADIAARAGWGASGQNCIGAERFFVHASLVDAFVGQLSAIAGKMRQGPPLNGHGHTGVDIGALCLPGEAARIQDLVDDAVARGARVAAGGHRASPAGGEQGQYYAPTVVQMPTGLWAGAREYRLLQEEVFGPLITVVPFTTDAELLELANGCDFALGSSVFGRDEHVSRVGAQIDAGMLACNDFATCYMCQSLPMGGLKDSGFGKFAGVEGLRGLCVAKAVVEDLVPWVRTQLPPPLRFPLSPVAFPFTRGLLHLFYGHSLASKLEGVARLLRCVLAPAGGYGKYKDKHA